MKVELVNGKSPIGETIRAVAAAQSSRLFKSELNYEGRSAIVFMIIRSEIVLALYDQGLPLSQIIENVDPTDDVLAQMIKDGYKLSMGQLLGGGDNA